jgi:hypothetical protein
VIFSYFCCFHCRLGVQNVTDHLGVVRFVELLYHFAVDLRHRLAHLPTRIRLLAAVPSGGAPSAADFHASSPEILFHGNVAIVFLIWRPIPGFFSSTIFLILKVGSFRGSDGISFGHGGPHVRPPCGLSVHRVFLGHAGSHFNIVFSRYQKCTSLNGVIALVGVNGNYRSKCVPQLEVRTHHLTQILRILQLRHTS